MPVAIRCSRCEFRDNPPDSAFCQMCGGAIVAVDPAAGARAVPSTMPSPARLRAGDPVVPGELPVTVGPGALAAARSAARDVPATLPRADTLIPSTEQGRAAGSVPQRRACRRCRVLLESWWRWCSGCGAPQRSPAAAPKLRVAGTGPSQLVKIEGTMTIGRHGCTISFPFEDSLAPCHARLRQLENGVELSDAGSGTGVLVELEGECFLAPGDQFRIGGQRFLVSPGPVSFGHEGGGSEGRPAPARLLRLLEADQIDGEYPLLADPFTIGRAGATLCFPDDTELSAVHAQLQRRGLRYSISPVPGSGPVWLKLRSPRRLLAGARFRVGRLDLALEA